MNNLKTQVTQVIRAAWKQYEPFISPYMELARPWFQNTNANEYLVAAKWKPKGGDPFGDFQSAWAAAFNDGTVKAMNSTHFTLNVRRLDSGNYVRHFQATWQLLPQLDPLYKAKDWEGHFDGSPLSNWMAHYYWIPVVISIGYVISIFSLKALMSRLPALSLTMPLFLWNLLLAAFSTAGAVRTVPHIVATIQQKGWYYSICTNCGNTFGAGEVGLWAFLFIISKIPELVDTVFIVLRKKPLILLHWYHHW